MIIEMIQEWFKELLIDGIISNLSGTFDTVNTKVAEIAGEVGMTPSGWNGGIFNMIRSLSETVIVPIAGIILTVGFAAFPFLLPSSTQAGSSLTLWDASSSHMTLFIMLVCAVIFVPIIIAYTSFVYRVLWGKVDAKDVNDPANHAY